MWGPKIETEQGELIAEGHEDLWLVLEVVLGREATNPISCQTYDCDAEATHTVELGNDESWSTSYVCPACLQADEPTIHTVYEGLTIKPCDHTHCYNLVHESRDYCTSDQCKQ